MAPSQLHSKDSLIHYVLPATATLVVGYSLWRNRRRSATITGRSAQRLAKKSKDKNLDFKQCNTEPSNHTRIGTLLKRYKWDSYKDLPSTMQAAIEAVLLQDLLQIHGAKGRPGVPTADTCSRLLEEHVELRSLLLGCWETGSFQALVQNVTFASILSAQDLGETIYDPSSEESRSAPDSLVQPSASNMAAASTNQLRLSEDAPGSRGKDILQEDKRTPNSDFILARLEQVDGGVSVYGGIFNSIAGDFWQINSIPDQSDLQKVVTKWLSPIDYHITHNDVIKKRAAHTGSWFFASVEFGRWLEDHSPSVLWCPGIPGVGKTVMAGTVIEYLRRLPENVKSVAVGFVYFNYKLQSQQSAMMILESLSRQVYEASEDTEVTEMFEALYAAHRRPVSRPTRDELTKSLGKALRRLKRCYIVFDALDEYLAQYNDNEIKEILYMILQLGPKIKFLVTSRTIGRMEAIFKELGALREEIITDEDDMSVYLKNRLNTVGFRFEINPELAESVIQKVKDAAKGRFLMAELHMNSLAEQLSPGDLEDALDNLPHSIDATYVRVMERIASYPKPLQELAMKALMWVAYNQRRLTVRELQHALATKPGRLEIGKYVTPMSTITSACAGLVVVRDEDHENGGRDDRILSFVHFTAQEFFQTQQLNYFPDYNRVMAHTCMDYLSLSSVNACKAGVNWNTSAYGANIDQTWQKAHPFYDYAALNLGHYTDTSNETLTDDIFNFLCKETDSTIDLCVRYILYHRCDDWFDMPAGREAGVFLAICYNHVPVLSRLLDSLVTTPLTWKRRSPIAVAVRSGHTTAIPTMIGWCSASPSQLHDRMEIVGLDRGDTNKRTPLWHAAALGYTGVVELLLRQPTELVSVNARDSSFDQTPLAHSAEKGYDTIVKLFLDLTPPALLDVNQTDILCGRTPLTWAVEAGRTRVVEVLVNHPKTNVNWVDKGRLTPLLRAARRPKFEARLVEALLAHPDIDVDATDKMGRTALSMVVERGVVGTTALLLAKGPDVNSTDKNGRTPLWHATVHKRQEVVELLLKQDRIAVNKQDSNGRTALCALIQTLPTADLYWAEEEEKVILSIICSLAMREDVDVRLVDEDGCSPLSYASKLGPQYQRIGELLRLRAVGKPLPDWNADGGGGGGGGEEEEEESQSDDESL